MLVAICWDVVAALVKRNRGRNWPTVSAVIDAVSVTVAGSNGISSLAVRDRPYYKATLTYTYNNPEQQMADYSRDFANEDDAKAWANSYKGETVKVSLAKTPSGDKSGLDPILSAGALRGIFGFEESRATKSLTFMTAPSVSNVKEPLFDSSSFITSMILPIPFSHFISGVGNLAAFSQPINSCWLLKVIPFTVPIP